MSRQDSNRQRTLMKQGKLYDASTSPNGSQLITAGTMETLGQLRAPVAQGVPITPTENPKPRFFLNNSLPHTHSGYTEPTHNLLKAFKAQGVDLHAVTRLGYPVVVGKIPPVTTKHHRQHYSRCCRSLCAPGLN